MQLHNNSFQAAFDYVYKHYFDDYDWFMKADDDTYVIMENLRYFLSGEDKKEPIYFGHFFVVSKPSVSKITRPLSSCILWIQTLYFKNTAGSFFVAMWK